MAIRNSTGAAHANTQCIPALTKREMLEGERAARSWGMTRRAAAASLTRTFEQLTDGLKEDPKAAEVVRGIVENIAAYLRWRDDETELLKLARLRLLVALREAEAHPEASHG